MLRNKNINTILIISIFLFSIKWILSFYFFKENLSVRIIFESVTDGHYYYPLIKYLAFFEFNNSFDPHIDNLKIIPYIIIKKQDYCRLYDGNIYTLYLKKSFKVKCDL